MSFNEKDYTKIQINKVSAIPRHTGKYQLYHNWYWAVTEDNCILRFKNVSFQCNPNREVAEIVVNREGYPAERVEQLEHVWIKH